MSCKSFALRCNALSSLGNELVLAAALVMVLVMVLVMLLVMLLAMVPIRRGGTLLPYPSATGNNQLHQ